MSYSYEEERPNLFTPDGFEMLTRMRDKAKELLKSAGAVRADKLMDAAGSGSSWTMMAAIDYMIERGDLRRISEKDWTGGYAVLVDARD